MRKSAGNKKEDSIFVLLRFAIHLQDKINNVQLSILDLIPVLWNVDIDQ